VTIDVAGLFPGAGDGVYLNTASMALGNQRGVDALNRAVDQWSRVSFDVADSDATIKAFENDNIIASARAGKVRVSMHLYNTVEDVDRLVAAIA